MSYMQQVKPRIWKGQDWILPDKIILALLALSLLLFFFGIVLLAIGFSTIGGILTGLGGCGLMVLLMLCIHAYCCRYTADAHTQTGDLEVDVIPAYAVINKPSSLKRSDSGSRRNGTMFEKHVTLSPDTELKDNSVFGSPTINTNTTAEQGYQVPIQYSNYQPAYGEQGSNYGQSQNYRPATQDRIMQQPVQKTQIPSYPIPVQYPVQVYPVRSPSSTCSSIRYGIDDDYDNPMESTPIMSNQSGSSSLSSHQAQSRFTSSRQVSNVTSQGGTSHLVDDLPEPQPLVYPSAKRPMTFEQASSSKMSVYDNVLPPFPNTID